jgi:hypothetical protein
MKKARQGGYSTVRGAAMQLLQGDAIDIDMVVGELIQDVGTFDEAVTAEDFILVTVAAGMANAFEACMHEDGCADMERFYPSSLFVFDIAPYLGEDSVLYGAEKGAVWAAIEDFQAALIERISLGDASAQQLFEISEGSGAAFVRKYSGDKLRG